MIEIHFTEDEIRQLRQQHLDHPDARVRVKMEAVLLKSEGLAHGRICRIVGISENTLRSYLRAYQQGGIEKLQEQRPPRPARSELSAHRAALEAYFRQHPPATAKEAAAKIEELTGIHRGLTQVREFLKSLGMRRRKVGSIPAKADVEEQARFKKRRTRTPAGRSSGR